jgi:hypothetical protein
VEIVAERRKKERKKRKDVQLREERECDSKNEKLYFTPVDTLFAFARK